MSGGGITGQLIGAIFAGLGLWSGLFLWAIKWLLDRNQAHIDQRFGSVEAGIKQWADKTAGLERDFLRLQGEIAREYVRREDWIRFGTQFRAQQDQIWAELDTLKEHAHGRGPATVTG